MRVERRDSTTCHRRERRPLRREEFCKTVSGVSDRPGSTHSAVSDPAQDVFYRSCSQFCIDQIQRDAAPERSIRQFQPSCSQFLIADIVFRQSDNACNPVQAIRFKRGQPAGTPPLQTANGKIQAGGEFFQRHARGMHHFPDDDLRKTFANCREEFAFIARAATESVGPAEFRHHSFQFANHSVTYCSANWRVEKQRCRIVCTSLTIVSAVSIPAYASRPRWNRG
jgi:hypothetical protein